MFCYLFIYSFEGRWRRAWTEVDQGRSRSFEVQRDLGHPVSDSQGSSGPGFANIGRLSSRRSLGAQPWHPRKGPSEGHPEEGNPSVKTLLRSGLRPGNGRRVRAVGIRAVDMTRHSGHVDDAAAAANRRWR